MSPTDTRISRVLGRSPPFSAEAEAYLLSCCFVDSAEVVAKCQEAGLTSTMFYVPANRPVFDVMVGLHSRGIVFDLALVAEELKAAGKLDQIGGYGHLIEVSAAIPTTAQAPLFIEKLLDLHKRRELIKAATSAVESAYGTNDTIDAISGTLTAKISALSGHDSDSWEVVTAAELQANPPPTPSVLIDGLLYQGGTMLMSGASKSMKTYTMLAAAQSVSTGREWMGFKCAPTSVLVLNLELQDFAMHSRLYAVARAMNTILPPNLHVANLRGKLVNIDAVETKLNRLLEQTKAGLVIIDPHYKISSASGIEENSNDAQGLLLYRLENVVCRSGAALMLAHHFSKGDKSQTKSIDRAAGGGALARWPDVVMTLTEHEEEACATAEFSLRNFAPIAPFVVRWRYPLWTRDTTLNPSKLKKAGRTTEYNACELLPFLIDGMSAKDWRDASKWSEGTFRRKREELIDANKVRHTSGCFYHAAP